MSRPSNTVSVSILDKEYQVACPEDQQADLLLSARHLDEHMRSIRSTGKVIGLERIAVMAALNISHELLQVRNGEAPPAMATESTAQGKGDSKESKEAKEGKDSPAPAGLSGLNAKLDEALHQLRQLEIG